MFIERSTHPLVSVIIPNYNNSGTVVKAVSSVINGTYKNVEILIYDDCSKDNSVVQIESLMTEHPQVKVFYGEKNMGAGYARSVLLSHANGKIFAFLDADDIWETNKLEMQVNKMINDHIDIVTCGCRIVNQDDIVIGCRKPPDNLSYNKMLISNWIPMSMTIVSAELSCVRQMPVLRSRQDYAYWLQLFKNNPQLRYSVIHDTLGVYVRSPKSLSGSKLRNIKNNYFMFRSYLRFSVLASLILTAINGLVRVFRR